MEIESNPSQRVHQHRLSLFKQETAVVEKVLAQQSNIFSLLISRVMGQQQVSATARPSHRYYTEQSKYRSQPTGHQRPRYTEGLREWDDDLIPSSGMPIFATDAGGLRGLLIKDCLDFTARRSADFEQLNAQATDLEDMVSVLGLFNYFEKSYSSQFIRRV